MAKSPFTLGEYRNLQQTEGKETYQFEVKLANGWKLFTSLGGDSDEDRRAFAQKTADAWRKK